MCTATIELSNYEMQTGFETILPTIQRVARYRFRHLQRYHDREDATAETIGVCWNWFQRLIARGKHPERFSTTLAHFACRFVACGRRLSGPPRTNDVLSHTARKRHGFQIESLECPDRHSTQEWEDALTDDTQTPVPDQAAFRLDFPTWLDQLSYRDRHLVDDLALGYGTEQVARKYQVSPGRVSQLRREFQLSWQIFHGELTRADYPTAA